MSNEIVHRNGFELIEYSNGVIEAWIGGLFYGMAMPWIPTDPAGEWYSRRSGENAVKTAGREVALEFLTAQSKQQKGRLAR